MNFGPHYAYYLEVLGVLKASFSLISRNIGGATAPPAHPVPTALDSVSVSCITLERFLLLVAPKALSIDCYSFEVPEKLGLPYIFTCKR